MTNEMVLKRTSNLVMPSHYVELMEDEISYLAGMLVCGAMGNGFKIGLEVSWFKVKSVCTFL